MKNTLSALGLAIFIATPLHGATPPPVPENLLACGKLTDAGERVRCYDAQIAAMKQQSTAPAAPVVAAPAAPSATPRGEAAPAPKVAAPAVQLGDELLPRSARKTPEPSREEMTLHATISTIREVQPTVYLIALSNGQVWRPEGSRIIQLLSPGDAVRIDKAALGSYRLLREATGSKEWVRVTRVQ